MADEHVENTCEDNVSEVENENQEKDDKGENDGNQDENDGNQDENDGNQDENDRNKNENDGNQDEIEEKFREKRSIINNYKYPPQLDHKGEMKELMKDLN
ncbi:hypothetical protein HZU67_06770 [Apis mellifera carnica]|nr:hypothetical protein HZU67_06770 [Apis mellifera carnica]